LGRFSRNRFRWFFTFSGDRLRRAGGRRGSGGRSGKGGLQNSRNLHSVIVRVAAQVKAFQGRGGFLGIGRVKIQQGGRVGQFTGLGRVNRRLHYPAYPVSKRIHGRAIGGFGGIGFYSGDRPIQ
jgi:hypothetical protein